MTAEVRRRAPPPPGDSVPAPNLAAGAAPGTDVKDHHPSGKVKYGVFMQVVRGVSFAVYFLAGCIAINIAQLIGAPLYWINRDLYYAYMSVTKQSFGLLITTVTSWWGPTTIRVSGDHSVAGDIRQGPDGLIQFAFPERLIMIANHQIYTDWLYLWWVGYANNPQMHGFLYIILKESLKYIPIVGTGMMFYGFIFMSRKMAVDQPRMAHRLSKLRNQHTAPDGSKYLSPMWLLLFPEGTNLTTNTRERSARWADKNGLRDMKHQLLPRSTGMFFCLNELKGTVQYVYDCTVAYEGIPPGQYGDQFFGLSSTYFQGRPPKSVNFYWRRFRVADIPIDDPQAFDIWLRDRWYEKDALIDEYKATGRFPASPAASIRDVAGAKPYVETAVQTRRPLEWVQIFTIPGVFVLCGSVVWRLVMRLWGSMK